MKFAYNSSQNLGVGGNFTRKPLRVPNISLHLKLTPERFGGRSSARGWDLQNMKPPGDSPENGLQILVISLKEILVVHKEKAVTV